MKKNRSMRLATLLLALTLITSCFVGGTFAKYTTSDNAEDTARVAKWGVHFTMTNENEADLFMTEYSTHNTAYSNMQMIYSVKSDEKVVAPGTSGNMVTFSVNGQPEVSYKVTFDITDDKQQTVYLKSDTAEYYPIKWKYKLGNADEVTTKSLNDMVAAIEAYEFYYDVTDGKYKDTTGKEIPNTTNITINWEWDFDDNGKGTNDVYDTLLGDYAAGNALPEGVTANLNINLELVATATQID